MDGCVYVVRGDDGSTPGGSVSVVNYGGERVKEIDLSMAVWGRSLSVQKVVKYKEGRKLLLMSQSRVKVVD